VVLLTGCATPGGTIGAAQTFNDSAFGADVMAKIRTLAAIPDTRVKVNNLPGDVEELVRDVLYQGKAIDPTELTYGPWRVKLAATQTIERLRISGLSSLELPGSPTTTISLTDLIKVLAPASGLPTSGATTGVAGTASPEPAKPADTDPEPDPNKNGKGWVEWYQRHHGGALPPSIPGGTGNL
jgi:hypothetical protein